MKTEKLLKTNTESQAKKSSVFNKLLMESSTQSETQTMSGMLSESLFNLKLTDDEGSKENSGAKENESTGSEGKDPVSILLAPALKNYFSIIDVNNLGYLTFNSFIMFVKYLRVWDKLNLENPDPRGILNTNNMNCMQFNLFKYFFII